MTANPRFSIRKMTLGIASVTIGLFIYGGSMNHAHASELETQNTVQTQNDSQMHTNDTQQHQNKNEVQTTQQVSNVQKTSQNASQVKVTERDETIPYQTFIRNNPNMPQGMEALSQKGINGQAHVTTRQQYVNNQPQGQPQVSRVITRQKQDEIIDVGTGIKDMKQTTQDRAIPFDTVTRQNNDLPQGTHRIVRDGQDGLSRTTIAQDTLNGRPIGQPSVTTKTIHPPINRIIEVGVNTIGEDIKMKDEPIPYRTITVKNPQLHKGMYNVTQVGRYGYNRVMTTQRILNNKPYGEPMVQKTGIQAPIDEIVEIGIKPDDLQPSVKPNPSQEPAQTGNANTKSSYQQVSYPIARPQGQSQFINQHVSRIQPTQLKSANDIQKVSQDAYENTTASQQQSETLPDTGQSEQGTHVVLWSALFGTLGFGLLVGRSRKKEE